MQNRTRPLHRPPACQYPTSNLWTPYTTPQDRACRFSLRKPHSAY